MATTDFRIYTARQDSPQAFIDGISQTDLPYGDAGSFLCNGDGQWASPPQGTVSFSGELRRQYINDEAVNPNLGSIPDTKAINVEAFFTRNALIQTSGNRGVSCGVAALTGGGANFDNGSVKGYILNYGVGGGSAGWWSAASKGHTTYEDAIWLVSVPGTGTVSNSAQYESAIIGSAVKGSSVGLRINVIPIKNSSGTRIADVIRAYANINGAGWTLLHEKWLYAGVDRGYLGPESPSHGGGHWGQATNGSVGFYVNAAGDFDPVPDTLAGLVINEVSVTNFLASVDDA